MKAVDLIAKFNWFHGFGWSRGKTLSCESFKVHLKQLCIRDVSNMLASCLKHKTRMAFADLRDD